MPLHPLFQQIVDDLQMRPRPYSMYDDAQWPELPDVRVVTDEGGAAYVVHDPAEREAERERLHDPLFLYRR